MTIIRNYCFYRSGLTRLICMTIILFANISFAEIEESHDEYTESCGPLALSKVLFLLGKTVDHTKCAELAGTSQDGTTTFSGIVMAAQKIGVKVKGMHLTPQELAVINKPSILHVYLPNEKEHYVVYDSSNGSLYNIFDLINNNSIKQYTIDQLRLMWSGDCLVFSTETFRDTMILLFWRLRYILFTFLGVSLICFCLIFSFKLRSIIKIFISSELNSIFKAIFAVSMVLVLVFLVGIFVLNTQLFFSDFSNNRGHSLVIGTSVLDIGDVEYGSTAEAAIWLGNVGKKSLNIDSNAIKKSCNCFLVRCESEEIAPGDKSIAQIKLNPPKKFGPFKYSVLFPSEGTIEKSILLNIKGKVVGAGGILYPPRIYFSRVKNAKETRKKLFYILRRPDVRILNVSCNLPFLKCAFTKPNNGSFEIDISLKDLPPIGPFEGMINITTNDPETEYSTIEVPVSGIGTPVAKNEILFKNSEDFASLLH